MPRNKYFVRTIKLNNGINIDLSLYLKSIQTKKLRILTFKTITLLLYVIPQEPFTLM